jgi:hypothetical protein
LNSRRLRNWPGFCDAARATGGNFAGCIVSGQRDWRALMTDETYYNHPEWRRPAPLARKATAALYAWNDPALVGAATFFAALPFVAAALFSPALLSLAPTVETIAPVAAARSIADGASLASATISPLQALLLLLGDLLFETPGKILLAAQAIGAMLVAAAFAAVAPARFPAAAAVALGSGLGAYVAAPFAGPQELALALFAVVGVAMLAAPADPSRGRAIGEGALSGALILALWMLEPVFALAGFLALSACPFMSGAQGLARYFSTLAAALALGAIAEALAPGINAARADLVTATLTSGGAESGSGIGLAGLAVSVFVVIAATAIFGGRESWRAFAGAIGFSLVALVAARIAGAQAAPAFVVAAAIACFSTASPFYDGVFRQHDRASVALAGAAAALTLFWTAALAAQSAGQFAMQARAGQSASANIRAELGLVQPGGPTIARWIEEGRFSTPEARELLALAPVDQSEMLLAAASRARAIGEQGYDVAFLTGADTACVIAQHRACAADGFAAAGAAKVVFVPRLDLDAATAAVKARSEALLYTEFRMVERSALWEVWVRRGAVTPAGLSAVAG